VTGCVRPLAEETSEYIVIHNGRFFTILASAAEVQNDGPFVFSNRCSIFIIQLIIFFGAVLTHRIVGHECLSADRQARMQDSQKVCTNVTQRRSTSLRDAIINAEHSISNFQVPHLGIGRWTFDIGH